MTKAELKSQFQNSYNRESWMPILKLVFGQINFFSNPFQLFEGEEAVKQGCQIGYVDLPNNQTVAIFEIEVADRIIIERNRKGLRDIAAKYIKGTFSAALVFYHSKNQNEYRFSFIAQQSKIDEQTGEFNTVVTAPKRYTYVLGTPFCATAAERWIKLAAEPEINVDKITDAFSVEKLSKEFFDQYKIQYTRFCKFIEDDSVTLQQFIDHTETDAVKAQKPLRDYVKKLLGRLVFLQFLQKKGWMGVPATNKDWKGGDLNFMANLFNKSTYQNNYLDQVLEPLFFNTLNRERTNDIADKIDTEIKIPYLNGGLFEPTTLDDTNVQFPKHYFSELFEFFNQYNFTIDENDPDDAEVGIDPEMLGHIFENLLEDNKDKGAFYTPKEIVRYMCQESLIAYLHTHTPETLHPSVEKLIRSHKVDDCLQDKPNATLIQKLLVAVKICDPAIGSGAFPMGMLYEIFMVRRLLFGFLGKNESFSACLVKKEIIQNNIYGVDIEQGAVDIARLRFWLALVVDEDEPQALPNLDYKIMCGNSLISRFALDAPIKDVFAEYNKKYKTNFTLQDYKNIVDEYTDVHNAKEQFRAKIEEIKGAFKSVLLNSDLDDRKKIEAKVLDYEAVDVFGERKADKDKKGYKTVKAKLEKYLKSEKDTLNNKLYINSFEWRFEFPSLLDDNGNFIGFDVVIGNPPYGVSIKDDYRKKVESALGKVPDYEIYYYFIEIANQILKSNGIKSFIIPNTFLFNVYASNYRKRLIEEWSINCILDCTSFKIFEGATVYNAITIFKKDNRKECQSIGYKLTRGIDNFIQLSKGETIYVSKEYLLENNQNWALVFKLKTEVLNTISKVRKNGIKLSDLFPEISQGLIAYDKYQGQSKEIIKSRAYHYNEKINPELKNWLWGEDVTKFSVKWNGKEWIDYCDGIANPRNPKYFSGLRLLVREITNPSIYCAVTDEEFYHDPAIIVIKDSGKGIECVCAILNSKLGSYYHFNSSPKATKGAFPKILVDDIKNFPIKLPLNQPLFVDLVSQIDSLKKLNSNADSTTLMQQIDTLVYKLYELSYEEVLLIEPDFVKRVSVEQYECINVAEYEAVNVE